LKGEEKAACLGIQALFHSHISLLQIEQWEHCSEVAATEGSPTFPNSLVALKTWRSGIYLLPNFAFLLVGTLCWGSKSLTAYQQALLPQAAVHEEHLPAVCKPRCCPFLVITRSRKGSLLPPSSSSFYRAFIQPRKSLSSTQIDNKFYSKARGDPFLTPHEEKKREALNNDKS
jgi:hypothetical protein